MVLVWQPFSNKLQQTLTFDFDGQQSSEAWMFSAMESTISIKGYSKYLTDQDGLPG